MGISKWILLILALDVIPCSAPATPTDLGVLVAPEYIQKCFSSSGESFDCLMEKGGCYQLTPTVPPSTPPRFLLIPCKGAPLILNKSQQNRVIRAKKKQTVNLQRCQELKEAQAQGQWTPKKAKELAPSLWQLIRCLQKEADVEYEVKQEAELYNKIVKLLTLLTQHPDSQKKAHHELAILHEEYFNNYPAAFKHYRKAQKEGDNTLYLALGRTACLSQDRALQKLGLKYYLQAIEAEVLAIDVDNTNIHMMPLNSLLQQCGFGKLISVIKRTRSLYDAPEKKNPQKTLAFIRKYLD